MTQVTAQKTRKICAVTSTRADYSHLYYPLKAIAQSKALSLSLVVTGTHLSDRHGMTVEHVKADGFDIAASVPILEDSTDSSGVLGTMGRALTGLGRVFRTLKPDMVLLLGDRYEIMAAAQAALIEGKPIAHIAGGDVTEGAYDDAFRHSITKMSALHFVTNEQSRLRVIQLGENPAHVVLSGAPSLDIITQMTFRDKATFMAELSFNKDYARSILVSLHPETLSFGSPQASAKLLLAALDKYSNTALILTGANADTGGDEINALFQDYAANHDNAVFFASLGKDRFYHALKHTDIMVGNSSSAIYEAPSFRRAAVNIGDRQKGRLTPASVISCPLEPAAIQNSIERAFALDCSHVISPFGDGHASERIVKALESFPLDENTLKKEFHTHV